MPERVAPRSDLPQRQSLGGDDERPAMAADGVGDRVGYLPEGEPGLGEEDQQGRLPVGIGESRRRRDEPNPASHRLSDEHWIGRGRTAVLLLQALHAPRPIAGDRAVARGVVDRSHLRIAEVVVDRLRDPDHLQVVPGLARRLCHLESHLLGVVPPDREEVADVVGADHLDDPRQVLSVGQLVAGGPDRPGRWGGAQVRDLLGILGREVDQLLAQDTEDPVPCSEHPSELVREAAAAVDHPAQGVVDHRGRAAAHRDQYVLHPTPPNTQRTRRRSGR